MTIADLIKSLDAFPFWLTPALAALPPVGVLLTHLVHPRERSAAAPWRYIYSFWVYLTCIPGVFASVLTGYALFFIRQNLLQVNVGVYLLPILSMVVTLVLIHRRVDFDRLPGIERIYGLMILLAIVFIILFALDRMRVLIFFGGGFGSLILIAIVCFGLAKWGMHLLFRGKAQRGFDGTRSTDPTAAPPSGKAMRKSKKELKEIKKRMGIS